MARMLALRAKPNLQPVIELTRHGDLLCYEQCGNRWFRSSKWHVEDALAQFQGLYENIDCVDLNDLYAVLDICQTTKGRLYGWNSAIHGYCMLLRIDLKEDGFSGMHEPVLVISPNKLPEKDFKEAF